MSVIIPGKLYLGGALESAYNNDFISNNKITHIINCAKELSIKYPLGITGYRIDLEDDNPEGASALIEAGAILLKKWLEDPKAVILVHCFAGMSRSVSVVAAYLVINKNYTVKRAIQFLESCRPCIRPFNGFLDEIRKYETFHAKVYSCLNPKKLK
jgi:protein-tyrosine phosphatase